MGTDQSGTTQYQLIWTKSWWIGPKRLLMTSWGNHRDIFMILKITMCKSGIKFSTFLMPLFVIVTCPKFDSRQDLVC